MKKILPMGLILLALIAAVVLMGCASAEVRAVRSGDIEAIREYINSGGNVNAPQRGGTSLLMIAARAGQVESARLLMDYGAKINNRDNKGRTALMYAAGAGQIAMIEILLDRDAEINARDNGGATALIVASAGNRSAAAELLLARGADIAIAANGGWTALFTALNQSAGAPGGLNGTTRMLIDAGSPLDVQADPVQPIAFKAAAKGNIEVLALLIDAGLDTGRQNRSGNTLLVAGARHRSILLFLLDRGIPVNQRNAAGQTALIAASAAGVLETVDVLLSWGADPSIVAGDRTTALLSAVRQGNEEIVRLLLLAGADIMALDRTGSNVLHLAAWRGSVAMTRLLLTAGVPVNNTNSAGQTAIMLAAENPNRTAIEVVLIAAGAPPPVQPEAPAATEQPPATQPATPQQPVAIVPAPPAQTVPQPTTPPPVVPAPQPTTPPPAIPAPTQSPTPQQPLPETPKPAEPAPQSPVIQDPEIVNTGSHQLQTKVRWTNIRPDNVEGWSASDRLKPMATVKMRYYRESDWFLTHEIPIQVRPNGAERMESGYELLVDPTRLIECQVSVETESGQLVNATMAKRVTGAFLDFGFADFRLSESPDMVWPRNGAPVEVNFKYNIYQIPEAIKRQMQAAGDGIRTRGQGRADITIRIYDANGNEVTSKKDTFNPDGFKQGSFFPKTSELPEGGTIRYSFEASTTQRNILVVEGEWVVRTLYSHETRFRLAAETYIIPPKDAWEYRQGQGGSDRGKDNREHEDKEKGEKKNHD